MKNTFYWLPRGLSVLFIAFISIFALDVFNEPRWFLALLIHLIPSFILIILTVIAWKHERIGGFLFLGISIVMTFFFHSITFAIPGFIIGIFFLIRNYWLTK